ncbi:MAG: protoporphyrinogen oxidase [Cyanobacteria bacterium]|nr:protoporphyrinogen oxidase [Cyanobacteriota bacterium]
MQIAVVGGGITGLAAALRVRQRAPGAEVTLFEKTGRLGGKIHTERADGFVIEAGADSFLTRKPRGVGLCKELGVSGRLVARQAQHAGTFVRHGDALHPLPEGFTGMIPTRIDSLTGSALLSPGGRAALEDEESVPAPEDRREESIAEFVIRRFGREVYERIVEPLLSGIYGGNGERLSLDATFPQLRDLERRYGSVIRGLTASREQGVIDAAPPFVAFAGGMGELIEHLEARLREASIQTSVEVVALEPRTGGGFVLLLGDGAYTEADALILATPAPATARITRAFDRELSDLHAAIAYGSSVTVNLAFREHDLPRPVGGYGFVVPRVEGSDVVGVTVASNKWPGRATEGHALFRVYLRAHGGGDLTCETDDALIRAARRELNETYGVAAPPMLARATRWPESLPQYTLGHAGRVSRIRQRVAAHRGLFVAGAAYTGVGIPDCIASGEAAADEALAHFGVADREAPSATA